MANLIAGNLTVSGTITCDNVTSVSGTVQFAVHHKQVAGADVASKSEVVHIARAAGTIVAVQVSAETAPTGGDKQFTVDLRKGSQSAAYATVLSAVVTYDDASTADKQVLSGTLSTTTYAAGDQLKVIVTASGTTGSQGQDLCVTVWLRENPA